MLPPMEIEFATGICNWNATGMQLQETAQKNMQLEKHRKIEATYILILSRPSVAAISDGFWPRS